MLMHWPLWQQPLGQLVESQMHTPPALQRWPTAHCGLAPQRHWPPVHWFERVDTQAVHTAAIVPHAEVVGGLVQVPLVQQPVAQFVAVQPVQRWLVQFWPLGHIWHSTPPVPHRAAVVPLTQVPVAEVQQPFGQLVASHVQTPATQR
jgi:hypothetical protein